MSARPAIDHWDTAEWHEAVASFLRSNPDWLRDHPELYRTLTPPLRVHGEVLADHMAAMVLAERRHASVMAEQARVLVAAKRAASNGLARVHAAVLALIEAEDVRDFITTDLPRLLGLDVACLWCRRDMPDGAAASIDALIGRRDVVFRTAPPDAEALYGEAGALALHDVLIRIPAVGVLALASRDDVGLAPREMQSALHFLGQAIAQALRR